MEVEGEDGGGEHEMTDVHRLLLQYFIDVHVEKEAIVRKKLGDICAYFEGAPPSSSACSRHPSRFIHIIIHSDASGTGECDFDD
jgi:hypothetical protein